MNMKNIIYKKIFKFDHSQSGSVAVVVALSMIVLLAMFAFVIDTGYLYGEKNQYQNGVEAAAMAGAVSLCDGDPAGVARQVAIDNGLPAGPITKKTTLSEIYKLIFPHSNYLIFKIKNWSTINIFQCFLVDSLRLIHPTNYQLLYKIVGWIKERSDESTKVNNIKQLFSL